MPEGIPDCPKCAADGRFADWLAAHREHAVDRDHRARAVCAVADLLKPHIGSFATRADLAEQIVGVVEKHVRTTVWANWVETVRAQICREEGHNPVNTTTLGQLDMRCRRCGESWTEPRPEER